MNNEVSLSFTKKWWISIRPFSLPASTMPVIFGSLLAYVYGGTSFSFGNFALAFFAVVMLHSGANILNDIYDFKNGFDKFPNPVSGGVVRKIITTGEAMKAAIVLLTIGTMIGLYLAWVVGPLLLLIGVPGLLIGIFYTIGGKFALKYRALGDLAVFLNFGILGALGAWYVQTATFSWIPVLWAVPIATLVIAILHANNWRDIASDQEGHIFTIASLLGDKASLRYYGFLIFGPFFMVLALILVPFFLIPEFPFMPFSFVLVLLSLPMALKLWQKALNRKQPKNPIDFIALDGATAQYNLVFGLLSTGALLVESVIRYLL
ncbi:MAG: 1,4-dihydroxy-2-naphthoate octaprenyltransferase [Bacteroidales bacterium]|nr:1,4-dihydroxy-2-naphthoate octaprenyltransferase [Bacteroidales bacterium]